MLVFVAFVWYSVYETAISTEKPATTRKGEWEEQVRTFRMYGLLEMSAMGVECP